MKKDDELIKAINTYLGEEADNFFILTGRGDKVVVGAKGERNHLITMFHSLFQQKEEIYKLVQESIKLIEGSTEIEDSPK